MIKLNTQNLSQLLPEIVLPAYDRSQVKAGIAHIGIGGFHRAHQALYTDELLQKDSTSDWGICGIALLNRDKKIYDALAGQDGLYTLVETGNDGSQSIRIVGSIVEYLFAPHNPEVVIEKLASDDIKIISLTITEGGYNFDPEGNFKFETPDVQRDLNNPAMPKTVFGFLAAALKRRSATKSSGLTILSCDNIQHNGDVARRMLLAYISQAEPSLVDWVTENVTFPNTMVDRITPVTTTQDIENLKKKYHIDDAWPVVCEPFRQWIIEDKFSGGRPDWTGDGLQFVPDVSPYEKMKIRILNGGHSFVGFLGTLYEYTYVHEAVQDKTIRGLLIHFFDNEVIPVLERVQGIKLDEYKEVIVERFSNPYIKDQLTRIISGSSDKIPKFILTTLTEQLKSDGPINLQCLLIAMWCFYLENTEPENIEDNIAMMLHQKAKESLHDPMAFIRFKDIFGSLAESERFTETYLRFTTRIRNEGIRSVASGLLQ